MSQLEGPPYLGGHQASYDQKFEDDDNEIDIDIAYISAQSNLQREEESFNLNNKEFNKLSSCPPPPPLIDLITVITPKQIENSKKWSVGVNCTSTALLFEYLNKSRLSIQSDGRLFIPSSSKTLSASYSSSVSLSKNKLIPHISHISPPRPLYFNNNAVIRINREWHIGELLPIIYKANINPPNISNETKNDFKSTVNELIK